MDTDALAVLAHTAALGSFSAAARRLAIAPVIAARRIARLERELGVRLVSRTTRSAALTPEGEALLPYAQQMLEAEAAARATLTPGDMGVAGVLRVTAPAALGRRIITPMLPALFARNPQLSVELQLTDRVVDLVGEGFDVAIRIADLRDSNLTARRVGSVRRVLCAAPSYLERHGRPTRVEELKDHQCLTFIGARHWVFTGEPEVQRVRVSARFTCSTIDGLHEACVQGLGISMHASWDVEDDVQAGRLVRLDLDRPAYAPPISAVFPNSKVVAPKLRVFIDALIERLRVSHSA